MKIAILTFQNACNYGAVLQAYALQTYLNSLPYTQAFLIDYISAVNAQNDPVLFPKMKEKGAKRVKRMAGNLFRLPVARKSKVTFRKFHDARFQIEEREVKRSELSRVASQYDCVIVGSDQVWNTKITDNDSAYFLDFVHAPVKKFSYAASIGTEQLSQAAVSTICQYLKDFQQISVREERDVRILGDSLKPIKIARHLDPVFLLDAERWSSQTQAITDQPYVLLYTIGEAEVTAPAKALAKKIAAEKHAKVFCLTDNNTWYKYTDVTYLGVVDPMAFVGLICHAESVVTNSFHGSVFSILFHKEFFVETETRYPERILNLLAETGLEERALRHGKPASNIKTVNWAEVDAKLRPLIQQSKNYLAEVTGQSLERERLKNNESKEAF